MPSALNEIILWILYFHFFEIQRILHELKEENFAGKKFKTNNISSIQFYERKQTPNPSKWKFHPKNFIEDSSFIHILDLDSIIECFSSIGQLLSTGFVHFHIFLKFS